MRNTMPKAMRSEAAFLYLCAMRGWETAKPIHDANPYDFVIRRGDAWETVQVKSVYSGVRVGRRTDRLVQVRRCNERRNAAYRSGEFNLLFAWDDEKHLGWLIPELAIRDVRSAICIETTRWSDFLVTDLPRLNLGLQACT